jgi:hypothetical protein
LQEKGCTEQDILPLIEDMLPSGMGLLAMLKVYLDAGMKHDNSEGVVCVAAVAFKPIHYKQFVRPWSRLVRGWDTHAFHATDFYTGGGDFKRDTPEKKLRFERDSRNIPNIVGSKAKRMLAISFRPQEVDHVAPMEWKEKYEGNMYSLAVQLGIISMCFWAKDHHFHDWFAYFIESGEPDIPEVVRAVERMRANPRLASHIRVSSFSVVDKGTARGLEAADLVAWHSNKHYMDKVRLGKNHEPRKDYRALVESAEASGGTLDAIVLTGERLRQFIAAGLGIIV